MIQPYKEMIQLDDIDFRFKCFINKANNAADELIKVNPHWHDMTEILYVIKGNAIQQVNEKVSEIKSGDVVIIRGQDIHATYSTRDTDILVLQFSDAFFNIQDPVLSGMYNDFTNRIDLPMPVDTNIFPGDIIKERLMEIEKASNKKKSGWEMSVVSGFAGLIAICFENYEMKNNMIMAKKEAKDFLQIVFDFVDKNYKGEINLEEAARLTNYSMSHFCRKFHDNAGMSLFEYVGRLRIKAAVELLKDDLTIAELAYECGFSSINSFIRSFKKYMGVSPGKYRKSKLKLLT
jgi:AraC-like DNA-binding protein